MLLNTENILLGKLLSWMAEHSIRLDGWLLARKGVDEAVDALAVSASAIPDAPPRLPRRRVMQPPLPIGMRHIDIAAAGRYIQRRQIRPAE